MSGDDNCMSEKKGRAVREKQVKEEEEDDHADAAFVNTHGDSVLAE